MAGAWSLLGEQNCGSLVSVRLSDNRHLVCRRPYGTQSAVPVRFNLDGDPYDDVAVYEPSTSTLFVTPSGGVCSPTIPAAVRGNDGRWICAVSFGLPGDQVVSGDFDRDGRSDLAVWRPSSGYFHVLPSSGVGLASQYQVRWGLPGDIAVPGRYIHAQRSSFAVYRPSEGNWYLASDTGECPTGFDHRGTTGGVTACVRQFGLATDVPMPQDYDGDGLTDIGLLRPSTGEWLVVPSMVSCPATVPTPFVNSDRRPGCRTVFGPPGAVPLSGARP